MLVGRKIIFRDSPIFSIANSIGVKLELRNQIQDFLYQIGRYNDRENYFHKMRDFYQLFLARIF